MFAIWTEPETQEGGQSQLKDGELTIPYTGTISKITCMDTGKELSFTKRSDGYAITPPRATQEVSQYSRVFRME